MTTFSTLLIDLDDTLYPANNGLWPAIRARISEYMVTRMGFAPQEANRLRHELFLQYGTTLRGLQVAYAVDEKEFLAFVHDVPLGDYLAPNPALRDLLLGLPARKFIFTNGDAAHAGRVLAALGLEGCFDGVIDITALTPYCKPMPEAFEIALRLCGEPTPARCVMVDDLARTTRAARAAGLFAVLFGAQGPSPDADATLSDWRDFPALLNERLT